MSENNHSADPKASGMPRKTRRDMLKAMGTVPAIAVASSVLVQIEPAAAQPPLASAGAPAMPMPMSMPMPGSSRQMPDSKVDVDTPGYQPRMFDAAQWQSLRVLCDLIIPADEQGAGAVAAGVPEFIDDWLHHFQGDQVAEIYGGLVWLDLESNRQTGRPFANAPSTVQHQLLDRIAYPKRTAPHDRHAAAFFNNLRDLVCNAYFSSKQGIEYLGYLGNRVNFDWEGCPENVLRQIGVRPLKVVDGRQEA